MKSLFLHVVYKKNININNETKLYFNHELYCRAVQEWQWRNIVFTIVK